jgi:hypothetical protein
MPIRAGPVGLDRAGVVGQLGGHLDPLAQRPVEQVGHAADQRVEVDHLGLERLAAGEGEQLPGQRRGPARRLDHRLGEADSLLLGDAGPAQHVGRALDDGQEIVEIMGDAAGELAERLHLVGLAQLLLGLAALDDLDLQFGIGVGERVGPLLQFAVGPLERVLGEAEHRHHQSRHQDQQADH